MKKYLETKAESLENKITQIFGETVAKEGNKFSAALMAARENGKKFFSVNGKQFKTEDYQEEGFGANMGGGNQGVATVRRDAARAKASGPMRTHPGQITPKKPATPVKKPLSNDNTNDKSDDGKGMDKVQPDAVKKKFNDRKDKDIDNDGDVDSSDKYLHKRRKAISKAVKTEEKKSIVDIQQEKNQSMREMLAKIWGIGEGKSPFQPEMKMKKEKTVKTETGEKATKVEVNPEIIQPGSSVTTPDR